jgi:hypothetical protein
LFNNPLGVAVFIVAFMTRPAPVPIMEPHLNTFASGRWGDVAKKFTANDIDLHDRLVSKRRSMQNQHGGAGKPHARRDLHVGPGSARYLFCGLPGSVQRLP